MTDVEYREKLAQGYTFKISHPLRPELGRPAPLRLRGHRRRGQQAVHVQRRRDLRSTRSRAAGPAASPTAATRSIDPSGRPPVAHCLDGAALARWSRCWRPSRSVRNADGRSGAHSLRRVLLPHLHGQPQRARRSDRLSGPAGALTRPRVHREHLDECVLDSGEARRRRDDVQQQEGLLVVLGPHALCGRQAGRAARRDDLLPAADHGGGQAVPPRARDRRGQLPCADPAEQKRSRSGIAAC